MHECFSSCGLSNKQPLLAFWKVKFCIKNHPDMLQTAFLCLRACVDMLYIFCHHHFILRGPLVCDLDCLEPGTNEFPEMNGAGVGELFLLSS